MVTIAAGWAAATTLALRMLVAVASITVAPAGTSAQGVRLDLATYVAVPALDAASARVFQGLGAVRPGLGIDFGIGYDRGPFGVVLTGGFAGIEVGKPVVRDGIGMGRVPGIYRNGALMGHWTPSYALGRWRPVLALGVVREGIDNVLLRADSLPAFAQPLAPSADSARRPAGVNGSGIRVGVGFQREISAADFSGRMTLGLNGVLDVVRFGHMEYDGRRGTIPDAGVSLIPRATVALKWSPRAR